MGERERGKQREERRETDNMSRHKYAKKHTGRSADKEVAKRVNLRGIGFQSSSSLFQVEREGTMQEGWADGEEMKFSNAMDLQQLTASLRPASHLRTKILITVAITRIGGSMAAGD